jgi:hypothetical protein
MQLRTLPLCFTVFIFLGLAFIGDCPGSEGILESLANHPPATTLYGNPGDKYPDGYLLPAASQDDVTLNVSASEVGCGQSTRISWSSPPGSETELIPIGKVPNSGEQEVLPRQNTTYTIRVKNAEGVFTKSVAIRLNTTVQASFSINPTEVRYRKIADKILTQDSYVLTWTTSNADEVSINGLKVDLNGFQTIPAEPTRDMQPVDETHTFILDAHNMCGGHSTQTAAVHLTGSVEPAPLPNFPKWPKWTERYQLPQGLVVDSRTHALGDCFDRIMSALKNAEIYEWGTYALGDDGFAVVTRMETIDADGRAKPTPERWSIEPVNLVEPFTLTNYLKVLFEANPGYYRVIVLAVTPHAIIADDSQEVADPKAMETLLNKGTTALPLSYRTRPIVAETQCEAFIYEFSRQSISDSPRFMDSSDATPPQHLIGAGLWTNALPRQ